MANLAALSPPSRPASSYSYSNFHLPSSSSSDAADDDAQLPFPTALSRRDFLSPDFSPASYLSTLHTGPAARHQTLEDLRTELRERSNAISAELLELVNTNYTTFLGLGDELRGGEERIEDVRVALLGFRRAVEEVKGRVTDRRAEVGELSGQLKDVREVVEVGRRMLEIDERLCVLEGRLTVGSLGGQSLAGDAEEWQGLEDSEEEDEEATDGDDGFLGSSPAKLMSLAREYTVVEQLADSVGRNLPFIKKMEERMTRCRNTILLDLDTAMKEARKAGAGGLTRLMKLLAIYPVLDGEVEAVRLLREK
jgi:hypothetical protein